MTFCQSIEVQEVFHDLGIPVVRRHVAMRLFEVLDVEQRGEIELEEFVVGITQVIYDGEMAVKSGVLLTLDLRAVNRRCRRIESWLKSHDTSWNYWNSQKDELVSI